MSSLSSKPTPCLHLPPPEQFLDRLAPLAEEKRKEHKSLAKELERAKSKLMKPTEKNQALSRMERTHARRLAVAASSSGRKTRRRQEKNHTTLFQP